MVTNQHKALITTDFPRKPCSLSLVEFNHNYRTEDGYLYRYGRHVEPDSYVAYKLLSLKKLAGGCEADCTCNSPKVESIYAVAGNDCLDSCAGQGSCVDAATTRFCLCPAPHTGLSCEVKACPNNCSFPRGVCNRLTGVCDCQSIIHPYDNRLHWRTYAGEDCSVIIPFAGAAKVSTPAWARTVLLAIIVGHWFR